MKRFSIEWFKNKYPNNWQEKIEEDNNVRKKRNTLTFFIDKYGEELGAIKYEEFKYKSKHTEEKFIIKYGEDIGKIKWIEYLDKKKKTSKRSIEYWLLKCNGNYEEAKILLFEEQKRDLPFYIKKHGEKIGLEKFVKKHKIHSEFMKERMSLNENREMCSQTLEKYIEKYGEEEEGEKIWVELLKNKTSYLPDNKTSSNVSQEFFNKIYNEILEESDKDKTYYQKLNKEYHIYHDGKNYMYDFVNSKLRKCVEFNGDFWHANPIIYDDKFYHPLVKKTSKEIWNSDDFKNNLIKKERGYDVCVIWEKEYRENAEKCLEKIKKFLYE